MRSVQWIILGLALSALTLRADEQLSSLKANGKVYSAVTVFKVTATDIYFTSAQGMANAKLKDLEPALQKHFHYDAAQASAAEQKQATANARYEAQKKDQPNSASAGLSWGLDLPTALRQAKASKKMVLLYFTGSDWCGWCKVFEAQALSTQKFADYAARKLVLVQLDFPQAKPQSAQLRQDNIELAMRFQIDGFPSFVLLSADGKELGRQPGYRPGGADAFIAELEQFAKK
ncbi:MAG TPA: thioredoxin family protein [Desulfuromonadaceae bacterium]|nr:thioredoxin family protein [Desulfuromonadaceae bacterium]